jgi:Uma2 family endonuclease
MATAILSPSEAPVGPSEWTTYRMTAEEYFRAIDADVFEHNRRIELWEGQIYEKMAKKRPHTISSSKLLNALFPVLPEGWYFGFECPILIDDFTAPLPDAVVIRGRPDDYSVRGSPKGNEIGLVIEVADTSLRKNLTTTLAVYARAGLPCYWIVNLVARRVEVYTKPRIVGDTSSYESSEVFEPGQDVPLVLDNQRIASIPVNDLLPRDVL